MNAKVKKNVKIIAAVIFLFALVINVKMTLDNPFSSVNAMVLAQETGTGDTSTGEWPKAGIKKEITTTYNEYLPIDGGLCVILTFEKTETICENSGNITCEPYVNIKQIGGTAFGECP